MGGARGPRLHLFLRPHPYFLRLAVDAVQAGRGFGVYALAIVASAALSGLLSYAMRRLAVVASRQVEYDLRRDLLHHLLTLDRDFYHKHRVGDLMNRLNTDLSAVREMVGPGILMGSRLSFWSSSPFSPCTP